MSTNLWFKTHYLVHLPVCTYFALYLKEALLPYIDYLTYNLIIKILEYDQFSYDKYDD